MCMKHRKRNDTINIRVNYPWVTHFLTNFKKVKHFLKIGDGVTNR